MTKTEIKQQVLELPEAERLEIADAIWSSLADPDALPPWWQRDLLDELVEQAVRGETRT